MPFYIAPPHRANPHLPDTGHLAAVIDEPLSRVLAEATNRSGSPRAFRAWHRRGDIWFELTSLAFRPVAVDRWEAAVGSLRFAIEKRADGWHAFGWHPTGMSWNPQVFPVRGAAEAWCTDSYGEHETAERRPARAST